LACSRFLEGLGSHVSGSSSTTQPTLFPRRLLKIVWPGVGWYMVNWIVFRCVFPHTFTSCSFTPLLPKIFPPGVSSLHLSCTICCWSHLRLVFLRLRVPLPSDFTIGLFLRGSFLGLLRCFFMVPTFYQLFAPSVFSLALIFPFFFFFYALLAWFFLQYCPRASCFFAALYLYSHPSRRYVSDFFGSLFFFGTFFHPIKKKSRCLPLFFVSFFAPFSPKGV